jgi:hypothetical protein
LKGCYCAQLLSIEDGRLILEGSSIYQGRRASLSITATVMMILELLEESRIVDLLQGGILIHFHLVQLSLLGD